MLEGFGPTPVHAIGEGSAAADAAGGAFVPRIDQRGVSRPYGAAADLGAYERRDATDPGAWILVDGELADGPSVTRVGGAWVSVGSSIPGGRVFVTSDGSEPSPLGRAYSGTFEVTASATLRAVVYTPDLASSVAARPVDVVVEPRATYALRVTTIGEGRVAVDPPGPYHSGTVVRLMAIPADRWAFSGWGGDFAGSSPRIEWLVNSDREVMAAFEALRYAELTVTRAGDGEVRIDPPTGPYLVGTRVRLEAIPSTNWEFAGWSGGLTGSTLVTSWVAETNTTVHAEFLALPRYPVSVSVEGYGSVRVDPPGPDYPIRTPVTLRAVDPSGPGGMGGWTFSRWKGDFPGTRNPITIRVARPARVVAEFVYRPWDGERYFLVVAESGAGRVLVDPQPSVAETYPVGTIVTMSAEAFPGWQFLQWSGDVAGSTGIKQVRVDRNLSVVGVFGTRLEPRVETSGGITGGVDLDPPLTYFPPGTRVRLTAIPGAGAAFTGWAGSLAGTNNPIEYVVNTVVPFAGVCRFGPLPAGQRALTLRTEGFGRVSTDPSGATVGVGTRVEFRAIPDLGQDFVGWGGDMTGTEPTRILTLDTSKSVTARFTRRPALAWVDRLGYGRTGSFRLGIRGMPGERYRVESSTDLKAWTPRQSISLRMHAEDLAIPGPGTESGAYFRAIQVSP
ncbi:MAG: chitobiase/beta-hexosaminidase C-terminal domain-containing protein [Verrucomicrobiales bacterium]|nr:chitobiase/beta-hexosaminidase C-terminal domain-containing protein [Verrucomicrobiales bacterium]